MSAENYALTPGRKVKLANYLAEQVLLACKFAIEMDATNGLGFRGFNFRVLDNGETRFHVTYNRQVKKKLFR